MSATTATETTATNTSTVVPTSASTTPVADDGHTNKSTGLTDEIVKKVQVDDCGSCATTCAAVVMDDIEMAVHPPRRP